MIGEIDFADIFFSHKDDQQEEKLVNFPKSSFIIFAIFLIFMPIIIMNLLTALAVDDVNQLREKAYLEVQRLRIGLALDLNFYDKKQVLLKCFTMIGNFFCACTHRRRDTNQAKSKQSRGFFRRVHLTDNLNEMPAINKSATSKYNIEKKMYEIVHIPNIYLYTSWALGCNHNREQPWWSHFIFHGVRSIVEKNVDVNEIKYKDKQRENLENTILENQKKNEELRKQELDNLKEIKNTLKLLEFKNESLENFLTNFQEKNMQNSKN